MDSYSNCSLATIKYLYFFVLSCWCHNAKSILLNHNAWVALISTTIYFGFLVDIENASIFLKTEKNAEAKMEDITRSVFSYLNINYLITIYIPNKFHIIRTWIKSSIILCIFNILQNKFSGLLMRLFRSLYKLTDNANTIKNVWSSGYQIP